MERQWKTRERERERLRFLPKIKQCMWDIQRQHKDDTAKQWEIERREVIHVLTAFVNKGKIEKNVCSKVKEKTDKQAKTKRVQHTQVKKDREVNI